jgi:hypothetical protein
VLANHLLSVAGDSDQADINATFMQPFVTYTTPDGWAYGLNMEATRDWENKAWNLPMNLVLSKVMRFGGAARSDWWRPALLPRQS